MAARIPRRHFARPFVITLAASGCYVQSTGSQEPPPPQHPVVTQSGEPRAPHDHRAPEAAPEPAPQPATQAPPVVVTNPPRPTPAPTTPATPPPAPPAPPAPTTTATRWTVTKSGASCLAHVQVNCPKSTKGQPVMTCNPPPPIKYTCPSPMPEATLTVVQYASATDCVVERKPITCPPNVMCNPPPPQKVACPTR